MPSLHFDFAFGQFDLYTPLQLAQYMSTIANGGTRIAPRLVKEIHETSPSGGIGNLEDVVPTKIMNSIQVSKEILDHIKEGLYRVTHGENGTSATTFRTYSPEVAGKIRKRRSVLFGTKSSIYPMKPLKIQPSSRMHHTIIQKS